MSEFKDSKNFAIAQFNFCWVIALRAEAIPIIEAFKMKILDGKLGSEKKKEKRTKRAKRTKSPG